MGSLEPKEDLGSTVPSQPPVVAPDVKPESVEQSKFAIVSRPGFGTLGRRVNLLANHFKVSIGNPDQTFYQYTVSICAEDEKEITSKGIRRKVIDRLYQTYSTELQHEKFAYDGDKSLYTVGPLPQNIMDFKVLIEDSFAKCNASSDSIKRCKHAPRSRTFTAGVTYAAKVPLSSISHVLQEMEKESNQDALRVLNTILRQQAANRGTLPNVMKQDRFATPISMIPAGVVCDCSNRGCLLVRQSFFCDDSRNFVDVGGGVTGFRGLHSSFQPTLGGLALNLDVSTTMILTPGPVTDLILATQNLKDHRYIDWQRAKKMLKNVRIKTSHSKMESKIIGLSERPCNQQLFILKMKSNGVVHGEGDIREITVDEYFTKYHNIELTYSRLMPCLDVGKPKRPIYLPVELCSVVSLQRYTKALSGTQRASLVEKSRQKPDEKIRVLTDAIKTNNYDEEPLLSACGISIGKQLTQVGGRVLEAPKLKIGNSEDCTPRHGRWNYNNKRVLNPIRIDSWAVVNFSSRWDISELSRELINCGMKKGIHIERPYTLIDEDPQYRKSLPVVRVEHMFQKIMDKFADPPQFLLCVLPERKNSDLYGPWKKSCLIDFGVVNQCASPIKINDQYLTNLLLKINAKLGGTNSLLAIEHASCVPIIKDTPTLILGMDVSHGSPGQLDMPSIAAVVGSRSWPLISKYRASVRSQSSKMEMIESLYKPLADGKDDGIMRELLMEFYKSSNQRKPARIIVFRDGVGESQFSQVLNVELDQMIKAYIHLGETDVPKFTVIVAQKNHHTKIFQAGASENVPPGTVVDTNIVHPKYYDFYMCAHAGIIGTSRPAHYHVLVDEIGFSPDELQNLILSLSYVYQRSTSAVSIVAPICYAHLAAQQMGEILKVELSESSSGQRSTASGESICVPELPRLHKSVANSMFFC